MPLNQPLLNTEIEGIINLFPSAITIYKSIGKNANGHSDYQCFYVNKQALDLFNISENDFLNKSIHENFPLLYQSTLFQNIEDVIKNNTSITIDYKRVEKEEWWQISISKYKDGFISSTVDITEKKQAEIQLKQSNELLLLSNWSIDLKSGVVKCDDLFFDKIIEEPKFEITLKDLIEVFVSPEERKQSYRNIDLILKDDEWHIITKKLLTKSNKVKYIEVFVKRIVDNNEAVGMFGTVRDITEKRSKEIELETKDRHLAESMRMLRMSNYEIDLINNTVDYELDYFLNVLEENDKRLLNVAEMLDYVADEDKSNVLLKIENTIDDGKWITFEYKINLKNGNIKYLECTLRSLFENDKCIKLFGTIKDITERKLYELALIEKQYQLHLSNELQQLGMLEFFPETNTYKISSNIKAILEEPNLPDELSVDEYYSYIMDEDINELKRKVNLAIALHKKINVLRKLKLKNNKIKYVEIVCLPKLENEKLIKYTGTFKDVTYQYTNSQALASNQIIISEVNKTENVGTWEYDLTQNRIFLSKELNEIYEEELKESYTIAEYFEYLFEEDRTKVSEFFRENIMAKRKFDVIRKIQLKNGKTKYIQIKASPVIENDLLIKYIGTVIDITQKHLSDLELQTSEARFRLFFEHNPIMYFIVNIHGTILSVNNFGIQHLGYSREELINQNVLKVFFEEDKEKAKQKLNEVITSSQNSNQWELRKTKKNGEVIWVKETAKSTKDIDGNIMFLILCEDITEEIKNREILKQKNSDLIIQKNLAESISIEKQRFASIISHEIRTPLNAVLGISNLLLMDNPSANQIENLNTLKYSAENLMLLVNDILDLTKLESGQIHVEKTTFNLQHIVNNVHQTFAAKAIDKKLDFNISINHKIPSALIGDPIRIVQILNNLISNALKYTSHGKIDLIINRKELISPSEIRIKFEVNDTGIGIPHEMQDSIFETFADVNSDNILKHKNSELGLSITNKLVQALGGKINVNSTPGEGSSFSFDLVFNLPIDNFSNDTTRIITNNKNNNLEGLNVLLVEDNLNNQMVVNKYLNIWHANIDIVSNGFEAIEKTKSTADYHIILMDLHMPEINGVDTLKAIRNSKNLYWKKIPVIAMTADAINFDKEKLKQQGFDDVIFKPFEPNLLFTKLSQFSEIENN
jgi:PAS domain S-box-containing protein